MRQNYRSSLKNCLRSVPGQLRISREIAAKRMRSLYISYTDNYNVVEVDFVDGAPCRSSFFR